MIWVRLDICKKNDYFDDWDGLYKPIEEMPDLKDQGGGNAWAWSRLDSRDVRNSKLGRILDRSI